MGKLILLRHGQSQWNASNTFTGWVDVPLSLKGIEEAFDAGRKIENEPIDVIFTSTLIRAQMTAMLVMSVHKSGKIPVILHPEEDDRKEWWRIHSPQAEAQTIPVICAWELNERMYGKLQGMNKAEMAIQYSPEQVQIWRRSFDVPPPDGESLEMTAARSIPYFDNQIVPHLEKGQNVLVAAHGNSLRSIMMELDGLTADEVVHLELATGLPVIYDFVNGRCVKRL